MSDEMVRVTCLALVACVSATQANAQVLRGRFVDGSGKPAIAVLVVLTDSAGASIAATLSDSSGAYSLQARQAGVHNLQIGRIGYASQRASVTLTSGATVRTDTFTAEPLSLGDVRAGDVARCGEGSAKGDLWVEARKALRIIALAEEQQRIRVNGVRYLRELDGNARSQLAVIDQEAFAATGVPTREPSPDAPSGHWFAVADSARPMYFAATARALASEEFEQDHCFTRITAHASDTLRIGLSFEPRPGIPAVGITGTAWLERSTGRLLLVEYGYQTGRDANSIHVSGLVEFRVLPNAVPHVARWWLRMPVTRVVSRSGNSRQQTVRTVVEDGALVLDNTLTPISDPDEVFPALRGVVNLGPLVVESNPSGRRPIVTTASARPFDVLSEDEIHRTGGTNAFDLIRSIRPRWLRLRGNTRFVGAPTPVQVYVDGVRVRMPEPVSDPAAATEEALRKIQVPDIEAIQYLDSIEAPAYFGMGNDNGAILITLKKHR